MIATRDLENPARIGELSFFDVLHPGAVDSHRNMIFRLAGYSAGVTTDALPIVDDKSVFHLGLGERDL